MVSELLARTHCGKNLRSVSHGAAINGVDAAAPESRSGESLPLRSGVNFSVEGLQRLPLPLLSDAMKSILLRTLLNLVGFGEYPKALSGKGPLANSSHRRCSPNRGSILCRRDECEQQFHGISRSAGARGENSQFLGGADSKRRKPARRQPVPGTIPFRRSRITSWCGASGKEPTAKSGWRGM